MSDNLFCICFTIEPPFDVQMFLSSYQNYGTANVRKYSIGELFKEKRRITR